MTQTEHYLLERAKALSVQSPFYNQRYKDLSWQDYQEIPLIRKSDILADQQAHPPFGSNLVADRKHIVRIHRTSGTSDIPLLLALTAKDEEMVRRAGGRALRVSGMDENDIVFNCMNYCMWMGGDMDHQSIQEAGAAAVPYSVGNTENLIQLLIRMPGSCIHATPSYLSRIARTAKEKFGLQPRDLHIKKGFFGGEGGIQDKEFRRKIEETWDMEAIDANYGMSEALSIMGSECRLRNGLHFSAVDALYPELLAPDSGSVSNENIRRGVSGELVVSHLHKEAQPLIRYRTGDIIRIVSTERCPCGESTFRFQVIGRTDDMIVVKGINFYPEYIRGIISRYEACNGNYKIVIPDTNLIDRIKLYVEMKDLSSADSLADKIAREIKSRYFVTCSVILTGQLEYEGNKQKIIERTSLSKW